MNTIITRGLGTKNQLITQGYGSLTLVIIPKPIIRLFGSDGKDTSVNKKDFEIIESVIMVLACLEE